MFSGFSLFIRSKRYHSTVNETRGGPSAWDPQAAAAFSADFKRDMQALALQNLSKTTNLAESSKTFLRAEQEERERQEKLRHKNKKMVPKKTNLPATATTTILAEAEPTRKDAPTSSASQLLALPLSTFAPIS